MRLNTWAEIGFFHDPDTLVWRSGTNACQAYCEPLPVSPLDSPNLVWPRHELPPQAAPHMHMIEEVDQLRLPQQHPVPQSWIRPALRPYLDQKKLQSKLRNPNWGCLSRKREQEKRETPFSSSSANSTCDSHYQRRSVHCFQTHYTQIVHVIPRNKARAW